MTQCDIASGDFQQKRGALACGSLQRCVIQILDLVPAVRHFDTAPGRSTRCSQTLASLSGAFHSRIPLRRVNFEVGRLDSFAYFALPFLATSTVEVYHEISIHNNIRYRSSSNSLFATCRRITRRSANSSCRLENEVFAMILATERSE